MAKKKVFIYKFVSVNSTESFRFSYDFYWSIWLRSLLFEYIIVSTENSVALILLGIYVEYLLLCLSCAIYNKP